jgi:hypothetical protein
MINIEDKKNLKNNIIFADIITDRKWLEHPNIIGENVKILGIENNLIYMKYNNIKINQTWLEKIDGYSYNRFIDMDELIPDLSVSYGNISNCLLCSHTRNRKYYDSFVQLVTNIYNHFEYDIIHKDKIINSYQIEKGIFKKRIIEEGFYIHSNRRPIIYWYEVEKNMIKTANQFTNLYFYENEKEY